jgi:large conductance mechanosensitive channel
MVELKKPKFMDDFKAFITKGNMMDLAVGIIIGVAFGAVITSLVNDVLMPPIGLALGGVDFKEWYILLKEGTVGGPYPSLAAATTDGAVTWRFGMFINALINFLIVALVIFLIVKMMASMKRKAADKEAAKGPTTRACPHCDTQISLKATRCPNCTSEVTPETKEEAKVIKKKEKKDKEAEEEKFEKEEADEKEFDDDVAEAGKK